jgi:uncharacterized delta-60 repeat protein
LSLVIFLSASWAAPGDLDSSFDLDGKLTFRVSTNNFGFDQAKAVLIQGDGKIVIVGGSDNGIGLVRLLSNGAPDPAFGAAGVIRTSLSPDDTLYVSGGALQSDGKILVVGQANLALSTTFADLFVARFLTNGVLDPGFGTNGLAYLDLGFDDIGQAVALQADGRIVLAAYAYDFIQSEGHFLAVRLLANGAPDPTFDGDGRAEAFLPGSTGPQPTSVCVQADARLLLAGYAWVNDTNVIFLARFNTNGAMDGSFGSSGIVSTSLGLTNASVSAVAVQTNGRIVVAGDASLVLDNYLLAARYLTNGVLDPEFDRDGLALVPGASGRALAVQPDGRLLIAGSAGSDFGLFRFDTVGNPDASFGAGGRVQTQLSPGSDSAFAVALQPDRKAVLAGSAFLNSAFQFATARYITEDASSPNPRLQILPGSPGQILVSWAPNTPGFVLQETESLASPTWTNSLSGATNPVFLPTVLPASRFYRLFKP